MRHDMIPLVFLVLVALSTMGYVLWVVRMAMKTSEKKVEILRIYAERGEEPPQSVIDAVTGRGYTALLKPPKPETRSRHFSDFASCSVFAIGAAGIAWWRAPEPDHDPGGLMILAIVAALIFAAGAVSHLVTALHIRDGQ